MSVQFRLVQHVDEAILADLFREIDATYFSPHPFTAQEAARIAHYRGRDIYAILLEDGRAVAYGMLRGWAEGYDIPSLGVAVRTSETGRGLGGVMMKHLHAEAQRHGASVVRLRVHPDNTNARRLYEFLGYRYAGRERGELVMLIGTHPGEVARSAVGTGSRELTGRLLEVGAPEWQQVLDAAPYDFYHLPAYVSLCAAQERALACGLYISDGTRSMLLPLLVSRIAGNGRDARSPYGYPGPIGPGTDDPVFLQLALARGLQVLREEGLASVFVRLHPLLNAPPPEGVGAVVIHGETVSIDLTLPTERRWALTRQNHRRDITRALRLGYVARMDPEWTHAGAFKRLYRETMERRGASSFYFFDDAYFDGLREALGDRLHLCVVERDNEVAAAGLFVETNGIVQYHLSGTDEGSLSFRPVKLMIHFVGGWAQARGDHVLHLGGGVGGTADSLLHFKSGFSPIRHRFATFRDVIDWREYRRLVAARAPEVDPTDRSGFFPLYRERLSPTDPGRVSAADSLGA